MTIEPPPPAPFWQRTWNHPFLIRLRSGLRALAFAIINFYPIRVVLRGIQTLGRTVARRARTVPWINRTALYSEEKMRVPLVRNMARMILILLLFFGLIFSYEALMGAFVAHMIRASQGQQSQVVSTTKATMESWQKTFQAVGSLRAVDGADLSAELSGIVESIQFDSGDDVEAGKVLVTLRAGDDIAKLNSLKATAQLAEITLKRDQLQFAAQGVSQATIDTDNSNLANDNALVGQQQAVVDKKTVRAPFAGRLGIRNVDLGQFLNAGTSIVTLQKLDPIYMDFYVPQQEVAALQTGAPVGISVDTYPNGSFPGYIKAISPLVDSSSRNVQVRASVQNPEHKLLPGMYGTTTVKIGRPTRQVTVPQTAIAYNPYGSTVYIVEPEPEEKTWLSPYWDKVFTPPPPRLKAHQGFVTTGDTQGDQIAILTGVKAGDEVVTAGQLKLHNGAYVSINNKDPQPSDNPNPNPTAER